MYPSAFFPRFQEKAIVIDLQSENPSKRRLAEARLRKKYEKDFLIGKEIHNIKNDQDSHNIFEKTFQQVLAIVTEEGFKISGKDKSLNRLFDQKLTEELAHVLRRGDSNSRQRAGFYLAKRFGDIIEQRKFKRMLPDRQDRIEVFDDSLLALFNNIRAGKFNRASGLNTYFYSIFNNICIAKQRKNKRKKDLPVQPWKGIEEEYRSTLETQAWKKLKSQLDRIDPDEIKKKLLFFKSQHEKCYEIFYYHKVEDMTYAEIAEIMDSTANSIKTQANNCKQKWQKIIQESGIQRPSL